jgi:hypothetical protein
MEQNVLDEDFDFLARLAALQQALIFSSTCPVTIWRAEEGGLGNQLLAMYYDCVEDEETGLAIVKRRIGEAREEIRGHFRLHKSALTNFLKMDRAIVDNSRQAFANACVRLCRNVVDYASLAREHLDRLGIESFLSYPYCPSGHYFHILGGNLVRELEFNPAISYFGVIDRGIPPIKERLAGFKARTARLPRISYPFPGDSSAGFYDTDFGQHLSTNKLLLERAGMVKEEFS